MSKRLLAGVGGVTFLGLCCGYNRNDLARIFVFWLYLVTVEIGNNCLFGVSGIKPQAVPVVFYLAGTATEKPAKVDYGRARLAGPVDEQVDDAPHRLAGRALDVLPENTEQIGVSESL